MSTTVARLIAPAGAIAVISSLAFSAPALALDPDISVTTTADPAAVAAGDSIEYTTRLDFSGDVSGLAVADAIPPGTAYVDGSAELSGFRAARDVVAFDGIGGGWGFASGSGWSGDWREVNDDSSPSSGSTFYFSGSVGIRDNDSYPLPTRLERDVLLEAGAESVEFAATLNRGVGGSSGDTLQLSVTFDDAGVTTVSQSVSFTTLPAIAGTTTVVAVNVPSIPSGATTATISIGFSSGGAFPTTAYMHDAAVTQSVGAAAFGPLPGGSPDALAVPFDPAAGDWFEYTYRVVVDDVVPGGATTLTNGVAVSTEGDPAAASDAVTVGFVRAPALEASIVQPDPVTEGDDLPVTLTVAHGSGSDGADVCLDEVRISGVAAVYVSGDESPADGCLNLGETWTFGAVLSGMTAVPGQTPITATVSAFGSGEVAVTAEARATASVLAAEVEADPEPTSEPTLADTGAEGTIQALTGVLSAVLAGAALIALRRRIA